MTFLRERQKQGGTLAESKGTDPRSPMRPNSPTRARSTSSTTPWISSSGTIHARATVPDADGLLTPGGFARMRVQVAPPAPALLVPDISVLPDQSDHIVLTVGPNDVVTPKQVQIGDLRDGLRIIRSGLDPSDRVIVGGIPIARPGTTVAPHDQPIKLASNQN